MDYTNEKNVVLIIEEGTNNFKNKILNNQSTY